MKIKIVNKNNNAWFDVDEGATVIRNYNETLDSVKLQISNLFSPIDIEPFDSVLVIDNETNPRFETMYMCVDTFVRTQVCINPVIYNYDISLFSETKKLENIILPNLSITKKPNSVEATVFSYINQFVEDYAPKIKVGTKQSYSYVPKYDALYGRNIFDRTDLSASKFLVNCPEMQWNNPTLREVLNDLMMVNDCIPVLRENRIDFIDLSQKRNDISNNANINYIQQSQSSEDYVSDLYVDLQNAVQTEIEGVNNLVKQVEYIPFTCNDYLMKDNNRTIKTKYPIYNIKHFYWCFWAFPARKIEQISGSFTWYDFEQLTLPEYRFVKIDLCDLQADGTSEHAKFICEGKEWQTKASSIITTALRNNVHNFYDASFFKETTLYYNRGENEIKNIETEQVYAYNGIIPSTHRRTITNIMYFIAEFKKTSLRSQLFPSISNEHYVCGWEDATQGSNDTHHYETSFFMIEYETSADCVFKAGKSDKQAHVREVMDNQTNSYVDTYRQGFLEYQKANRLGNKMLTINARYLDNYDNLIQIGDFYQDSIVYQTQYQVYKHHIEVNCFATKDYVMRDYFTGVKAKIRSWKIVDGSEAFTRHDNIKYYCELSKRLKVDAVYGQRPANTISYNLLNSIYSATDSPAKYCAVRTTDKDDNSYPASNRYFVIELVSRLVGNSMVFTFGFDDNFSGARTFDFNNTNIDTDSNGFITHRSYLGGFPLADNRYVDDNGEFESLEYNYFNTPLYNQEIIQWGTRSSDIDDFQQTVKDMYMMPIMREINLQSPIFTSYSFFNKDNKEITKVSTQFEFCVDGKDIKFNKNFITSQTWIRNKTYTPNIQVYKSKNTNNAWKDFERLETMPIVSLPLDTTISITRDGYSAKLVVDNAGTLADNDVLYIVNKEGIKEIPLLAVCGGNTIYLNILRTRDDNIYNNQQEQIIIDNI